MGVNPVGNVQKYFTFDGESSKTYNTHITGKGAFDAPKRNVEMFSIPNRNGAFALDMGNFENIEITYEASIVADTPAEFSQAMSDLRNWLCSRVGYCRLEDDYNPNEYRMAVYKSGLEVEPFLASSGQFEIVFECKPQRFLTSGESAVSVTSGDTLTNPTLFDAKPIIQTEGEGTIAFNGYEIILQDALMGLVTVAENVTADSAQYYSAKVETTVENVSLVGDTVTVNMLYEGYYTFASGLVINSASVTSPPSNGTITWRKDGTNKIYVKYEWEVSFPTGANYTESDQCNVTFNYTLSGSTNDVYPVFKPKLTYTSATGKIVYYCGYSPSLSYMYSKPLATIVSAVVDSTKHVLGHPTIIDCDIGEAYKVENGDVIQLNKYIDLGSELPVLAGGNNTITYDNTFTSVNIIPNWWRV